MPSPNPDTLKYQFTKECSDVLLSQINHITATVIGPAAIIALLFNANVLLLGYYNYDVFFVCIKGKVISAAFFICVMADLLFLFRALHNLIRVLTGYEIPFIDVKEIEDDISEPNLIQLYLQSNQDYFTIIDTITERRKKCLDSITFALIPLFISLVIFAVSNVI